MDEDTAIINNNTRNETIKSFFIENKKKIVFAILFIIILVTAYFIFDKYKTEKKLEISDQYNSVVSEYSKNDIEKAKNILIDIINKEDKTYAPLSLYFIIDNKLITDKSTVNSLFDIIIKNISLEKEIKNLIIYKKALYNADDSDENELLDMLKPIINSDSVWKSQALYLMAEYFYSKNEKQKSKDFFNQIITLENVDQELKIESQKRLNRDLSE